MYHKKEFGKRNGKAQDKIDYNNILKIKIILLFAMLLLFASQVYAITGAGGSISLNSEIGSISYNGISSGLNNSIIDAYGGSSTIYGIFNSASFDGRLGLGEPSNLTASLSIITPENDVVITGTNADFNYIPSGDIISCSLYIDGTLRGLDSVPIMDSINSFNINNLAVGKHDWNMSCSYDQYSLNQYGEFTMIIISGFDANSTNLNGVNASAVPNLTLSKGAGKIVFDGYTDLSNGVDLSANVQIYSKSIYVNSAAAPELDKPATLTFTDIPFNNVIIWRDGVICSDCNILSFSNNKLVFNVSGFSEYTVTSTSKLVTYDDSDFMSVLRNQTMTFSANYTNITSGNPITGSCNITIPGNGTYAMTFNATSLTYQYTSSFGTIGIQPYTVQCTPSGPGFDTLELNSTFVISNLPPPTFADVKAQSGPTSSKDIQYDAVIIYAKAKNVTELVINTQTVTKTWQGYYGNVAGNVTLSDANSNSIYAWEFVSPNGEIYATRSPSVDWENVRCANLSELQAENSVLDVNDTAGDSVTNTFGNGSSFNKFYTGNVQINSSQNCYATHLNDNTGMQSVNYAEILLSDSALMIYTTLLNPNATGFDGNKYNFEMLVGANGHNDNNNPTMYYFYIEIG